VLDELYVLQGRTPGAKQDRPALSFALWLAGVPENVQRNMMHSDGHNYKVMSTPTLLLFLN